MNQGIETLGQSAIFVLIFSFVLVLAAMTGLLWVGWWVSKKRGSLSPYSKKPMALGVDIVPSVRRFVEEFLLSHPQPENEPFEFERAAICQETGRIFPNCILRGEIVRLDWSFLPKRFPGNFVSWGSLDEMEQASLRMCHDTLAGYQTEHSCSRTFPQEIDNYYAMMKPGPLYVDRKTKILLGWKEVPGTQFEVLIVQRPIYESIDETL